MEVILHGHLGVQLKKVGCCFIMKILRNMGASLPWLRVENGAFLTLLLSVQKKYNVFWSVNAEAKETPYWKPSGRKDGCCSYSGIRRGSLCAEAPVCQNSRDRACGTYLDLYRCIKPLSITTRWNWMAVVFTGMNLLDGKTSGNLGAN